MQATFETNQLFPYMELVRQIWKFSVKNHAMGQNKTVFIKGRLRGKEREWKEQGFIQKITYEGAITAILTLRGGSYKLLLIANVTS